MPVDWPFKSCAWMHCYLGRLCLSPPDPHHWKAEVLSFLHVLLVWGVNLVSLLNKRRQSWTIHLKQMVDGISGLADKEINVHTQRIFFRSKIFRPV
jgi:hypothetical protein